MKIALSAFVVIAAHRLQRQVLFDRIAQVIAFEMGIDFGGQDTLPVKVIKIEITPKPIKANDIYFNVDDFSKTAVLSSLNF